MTIKGVKKHPLAQKYTDKAKREHNTKLQLQLHQLKFLGVISPIVSFWYATYLSRALARKRSLAAVDCPPADVAQRPGRLGLFFLSVLLYCFIVLYVCCMGIGSHYLRVLLKKCLPVGKTVSVLSFCLLYSVYLWITLFYSLSLLCSGFFFLSVRCTVCL